MKKDKKITLTNLEFILIVVVGLILGMGIMVFINPNFKINEEEPNKNIKNIIDTYNEILNNYYTDLDETKLADGAIKGMLSAIEDPYTMYMDEATQEKFNIMMNGSYQGIGVVITEDPITIISIIPDSPAKEAGLQAGDIILSVDDIDLDGKKSTVFTEYVKESGKQTFTLKIKRDGKEKTIEVNKTPVTLKSVASEVIEKDGKKVGYIYVSIFALNTYEQFKANLEDLEKQNIDSLIIDLRENSGGETGVATNMISLFLDKDKIIYQLEDREGNREKRYSKGKEDKKYPIVILVNESTASASEIMTSALSENLGATVIGKTTYGKGTVQTILTTGTGEQYKMTISKWLTAKGTWINGEGIKPDIEVELSETKDTQLEKAVEYIVKR